MGARLVAEAMAPYWGARLNPTARVVLVSMALTALDQDSPNRPARLYFGGHEALALALDGEEYPKGTTQYESAQRKVRKAVRDLLEAGAIIQDRSASGRWSRTAYAITTNTLRLVDNSPAEPVDNPSSTGLSSGYGG